MPVDAEGVAAAVVGCPSVASLSAGPTGTSATYLPGRRVTGVRVQASTVEIHVVGRWGVPVPVLAAEVRAAAAPFIDGHRVGVFVEDLTDPGSGLERGTA